MTRTAPQQLTDAGIIAIIRAGTGIDLVAAADAMARGGITAIEITLNTPGALCAIEAMAQKMGDQIAVGAGTILCGEDALKAISAGASYIVTPTFQSDSIAVCRRHSVPICCGCYSTTEMHQAHQLGADFIKVFPATSLKLDGLRQILKELPDVRLVPTGGVSLENLGTFIAAGCAAVAVGSNLASKAILQEKRWDELAALSAKFRSELNKARMDGK